ncbi:uncharacterized protein LOC143216155 [Lasioglossum baleicum]|uniref:uncharacterized protein LOC143216155 n=1 Tax=Lasioglossum baleicum TaxID=434251 RepID=UPI003FCD8120
MLEPLIVLTVLNCFFMFSSTVTTCALWWQYRTHRCCFRRDPASQAAKHTLSKLKSAYAKVSKKNLSEKAKPENSSDNGPLNGNGNKNGINREKSNTTVHRDGKSKKKMKAKSNSKNWFRNRSLSGDATASLSETLGSWDVEDNGRMSEDTARMSEDTTRMSEASQTGNEAKSAVVMEYSTVQKIVQILDDNSDLNATKMAIRDFNARHNPERKIQNSNFEPRIMPIYTTLPQT